MDGIDEIRASIRTGQETLPASLVKALINTDSRLREWRKYRVMSQAQLGEAAELTQSAVTQIETGKRKPNIDTARKLADALQCDIDDLF
jgi:DNA-binding XRE family transcriptional regulator